MRRTQPARRARRDGLARKEQVAARRDAKTHLLLAVVGVIRLERRQFPGSPADLQSEGREEVNPEPLLWRTGGGEGVPVRSSTPLTFMNWLAIGHRWTDDRRYYWNTPTVISITPPIIGKM